jgi:hypothetical protein
VNPRALGAVATAGLTLSVVAVGCGSSTTSSNRLAWIGTPRVYEPRDLPRDRVVIGRIRNGSKTTLRLEATALRVRDAQGHVLNSSAGFTASYAHGLFGAFQQPSALPVRELVRLGRLVILDPGATRPLFAAWRLAPNTREPLTIDYGSGTLAVPVAVRPAAP